MPSSGEGSRGGKVIRHTKSGKAVYDVGSRITKVAGYAAAGIAASASVGDVAGRLAHSAAYQQQAAARLKMLAQGGTTVIGSAKATRGVKLAKTAAQVAKRGKLAKFAVRHGMVQKALEELHGNARVAATVIGAGLLFGAAKSAIEGTSADSAKNDAALGGASLLAAGAVTRIMENRRMGSTALAVAVALKKIGKHVGRL